MRKKIQTLLQRISLMKVKSNLGNIAVDIYTNNCSEKPVKGDTIANHDLLFYIINDIIFHQHHLVFRNNKSSTVFLRYLLNFLWFGELRRLKNLYIIFICQCTEVNNSMMIILSFILLTIVFISFINIITITKQKHFPYLLMQFAGNWSNLFTNID